MEEALLKRVMPHSIEAEQSVIGAMIMDRDAVTVASEMLNVEDFYQKQYGILFEAMTELYSEGKPIDLITLQNRLKDLNKEKTRRVRKHLALRAFFCLKALTNKQESSILKSSRGGTPRKRME